MTRFDESDDGLAGSDQWRYRSVDPQVDARRGDLPGAGTTRVMASAGIGGDFVREVQGLMKPGTSALFVLDCEGDMEMILHDIRGLRGTVLKTNVDVERARLIQFTLSAPSAQSTKADGQ